MFRYYLVSEKAYILRNYSSDLFFTREILSIIINVKPLNKGHIRKFPVKKVIRYPFQKISNKAQWGHLILYSVKRALANTMKTFVLLLLLLFNHSVFMICINESVCVCRGGIPFLKHLIVK